MMLLFLVVATSFYCGLCFYTDLKGCEIYVFPARVLSFFWCMYLIYHINPVKAISFILIHLFVLILMDKLKVWGGGDSEFVFLFSLLYLATVGNDLCIRAIAIELIAIVVGILISVVFGVMQKVIKKEKITKQSEFAVLPGIAIVSLYYLLGVMYG